jgi:hypothetical protein
MFVILYRIEQARSKKSIDMDPSYVDYIVKQYKGSDNFPDWLKPAIAWFSLNNVVCKWEDLKEHEERREMMWLRPWPDLWNKPV